MVKRIRWNEMDKSTTPFRKLRAAFVVYNQTTGKSPHTVHWYEFRLELFERWLGSDAVLADVTIPNVRAYIADLQGRTQIHVNNPMVRNKEGALSSSYISGFARALRAFASWLQADGYTSDNLLRSLKPPKIQQKVVEALSDEEVTRLIGIFDRDDAIGARDFTIVWTLLDCGLRASELCGLRIENTYLDQGYLKVLGKGNKERLVPFGRGCQEALLHWRDRHRPLFVVPESPYVFVNSRGEPLRLDALERIVKRAGRRADIRRLHCHLLRHTFATNFLVKEVGDSLRLQQMLGHTSLEMVRRYVARASVEKSLIDRRDSPMDIVLAKEQSLRRPRRVQSRRARGLRVVK